MAAYIPRTGIFHDPDQIKKNFRALNEQRNIHQFCDVILNVCGSQIHAHSNILAAASPYFGSILGVGTDCPRGFSRKQPQIIEIHIDSQDGDGGYGEAVSKVIEFMYTSYITLTPNVLSQVTEIGKIMQIEKLIHFCDEFQSGIDNNEPKSISTCTTGLEEIASLLGHRSRTIKKVSIATETEETVFKKISASSNSELITFDPSPDHDGGTKHNDANIPSFPCPDNSDSTDASNTGIDNKEGDFQFMEKEGIQEEDETIHTPPPTDIGFDTMDQDQNDASLLLAISNVRQTSTVKEPYGAQSKEQGEESERSGHQQLNSVPSVSNASSVTVTAAITSVSDKIEVSPTASENAGIQSDVYVKTLEDIMDMTVKPNASETSENGTLHSKPSLESSNQQTATSSKVREEKSINLEDISDLVKFDPVTTAMFNASSNVKKHDLTHLRKQRGRGRGRGRKRGRGRGPGRPRKVVVEPDSDPEFEEFIEKLERGDNVLVENETDAGKAKQAINCESLNQSVSEKLESSCDSSEVEKDFQTSGDNLKGGNSSDDYSASQSLEPNASMGSGSWKSKRKRFKPSQLRKDYVMHSLIKRTHKKHAAATSVKPSEQLKNENTPVPELQSKPLEFVCEHCEFKTSVFKDYRSHMKAHPETDPRFYVCPKCDFRTTKAREYKSHKHMSEELICSYCEHQSSTEQEFKEHGSKHVGDFPYFCTECDSKFRTKNQLMAHHPKHQLEKPFVCAICNSGFKWKHALKSHMVTHSATKDHLCDICGYATAHKSQLKAHRLIHTGLTFKCPVTGCNFQATKRQNLKYHMVTHTHEKPHQCEICGQSFSLLKNMRRHMLLHTDKRPYACKMCSFSTTRYDKLKEHNLKAHSIGETPTPRKIPPVAIPTTNITYVTSEGIAINPDGTISEESLQRIAQLATAQAQNDVDIQFQGQFALDESVEESTTYPIIATVQYSDDNGEQYIAEVVEGQQ